MYLKEKNFKCPEQNCKSAFALEIGLKRHIKLVHKQKIVANCSKCGKPFMSTYFARKHEIKCKNKPKNSEHCIFFKKATKVNNRKLCKICMLDFTPLVILERLEEESIW